MLLYLNMYLKNDERFIYYSNCNKHNKNTTVKYMINTLHGIVK